MLNSGISNIKVFACNSNKELAESIASKLGLKLGDCEVEKFSDGEISVKINETIRGADVFITATLDRIEKQEQEIPSVQNWLQIS